MPRGKAIRKGAEIVTLHQLLYFRTLARIQHYTKASQVLFISQPSLSHAISELEKELSVSLFERQGKKISLSPQGEVFLRSVEEALDKLDEGLNAIKAINPFMSRVNLGYIHSLSSPFIPDMLLKFYGDKDNKGIAFNFSQNLNSVLVEALDEGRIDLAFCPNPDKETAIVPILRQDLYIIMPKDHRYAGRSEIDVGEIEQEPLIVMDRKAGLRRTIDELFRNRGFKPTISFEAEGCSSVITFVSLHYGISILPIVPGLETSEVAFAKIKNPEFTRVISLAWKKERNLSPAAKRVRDFIVDNYALRPE